MVKNKILEIIKSLQKDFEAFRCLTLDKDIDLSLLSKDADTIIPDLLSLASEIISILYMYHYALDEDRDNLVFERKQRRNFESMNNYYKSQIEDLKKEINELKNHKSR